MKLPMDLHQALEIVLQLAIDNVIDDNLIDDVDGEDDGDMQKEQDSQNEACEVVQRFLDINSEEKLAAECGEIFITECQLKKKPNGRVDLRSGDKTPIGMTRTMFGIFSNFARGNV